MTSTWIVNASPIISLAKIGALRLLEQIPEHLVVPNAVVAEIMAGPEADPARLALIQGWGPMRATLSHTPDALLEWGLGSGETSVIALAVDHAGATAVLDDRAARSAARALGVPIIGTIGVLVRAKLRGLIPSAGKLITELQAAGLFLNPDIVRNALREIGEQ